MANTYQEQAAALENQLKNLQEKQLLLQRLAQLEDAIASGAPAAAPASGVTPSGKRRGRPPGKKNSENGENASGESKSSKKLPNLLVTISESVGKPLTVGDYVTLLNEAKYKTKAQDLPNMIYQALLKLVKKGKFKKEEVERDGSLIRQYEVVKAAA